MRISVEEADFDQLAQLAMVAVAARAEDRLAVVKLIRSARPVPEYTPAASNEAGIALPLARNQQYRVYITSYGQDKIRCIKAVRELAGLGLKEAKALVESCDTKTPVRVENEYTLVKRFWGDQAEKTIRDIREAGGQAYALLEY